MAEVKAKRQTKAERERKEERAKKSAAYARAYKTAVKMGFTGKDKGKGAWKAINAYCLEKGISYPRARRAKKAAE